MTHSHDYSYRFFCHNITDYVMFFGNTFYVMAYYVISMFLQYVIKGIEPILRLPNLYSSFEYIGLCNLKLLSHINDVDSTIKLYNAAYLLFSYIVRFKISKTIQSGPRRTRTYDHPVMSRTL